MARVVAAIVAACAAAAIAAPAAGPSQTATVGEYVYATIDNAWPQAEPDGSKDCSAQFKYVFPRACVSSRSSFPVSYTHLRAHET